MKCYDVSFEEQPVGSVTVTKEGLYYRFRCRCKPAKEAIYKLIVFSDRGTTDIGVCVPQADGFGLDRRIPVKRVGEGQMQFQIFTGDKNAFYDLIPVKADFPFSHISELQYGTLKISNGEFEIRISKDINRKGQ